MNAPDPNMRGPHPLTAAALQQTTDISTRAMKFKLQRGAAARRIRDKDGEALVKSTLGDEGQIVSRMLFKDPDSIVYKYGILNNEMYSYHIKCTLPFGDDGNRVLPNALYFDYTTTMQNYISRLGVLKATIINTWDALVFADVCERNKSLFAQGKPQSAKIEDYPTAAQMEAKLYITWYPEPISTSNDFRFTVPQEMLDVVDNQLRLHVKEMERNLYVQLLTPVTAFVQKLDKFNGDKGQRWHDSFVDNLNALTAEIPKMNITNDPVVDTLVAQLDAIVRPYKFFPDALKDDAAARASVKAKLAALESTLKGYAL